MSGRGSRKLQTALYVRARFTRTADRGICQGAVHANYRPSYMSGRGSRELQTELYVRLPWPMKLEDLVGGAKCLVRCGFTVPPLPSTASCTATCSGTENLGATLTKNTQDVRKIYSYFCGT